MATRFIEIARDGARLSLRNRCIVVQRRSPAGADLPEAIVPAAELSCVVLAHPQVSITHPAMSALMQAGCPLVVSDDSQMPVGVMLPLAANSLQTQRIRAQLTAPLPLRKRLWKLVVQAKVRAQAEALSLARPGTASAHLRALADKIRSGDPANIEAQAAAYYWPLLMGDDFRRRFDAPDQNRLLNYGYAIVRAAVARAIVAHGLHPSVGLHHKARGNAFVLADDLMEPYRPLVDDQVREIAGIHGIDAPLDTRNKMRLIELLDLRLDESGPGTPMRTVRDHISTTVFSLCRAFLAGKGPEQSRATLFYPRGLWAS